MKFLLQYHRLRLFVFFRCFPFSSLRSSIYFLHIFAIISSSFSGLSLFIVLSHFSSSIFFPLHLHISSSSLNSFVRSVVSLSLSRHSIFPFSVFSHIFTPILSSFLSLSIFKHPQSHTLLYLLSCLHLFPHHFIFPFFSLFPSQYS